MLYHQLTAEIGLFHERIPLPAYTVGTIAVCMVGTDLLLVFHKYIIRVTIHQFNINHREDAL